MVCYPNREMLLKFTFNNFLNKHKISAEIRGHLTIFKYLTCTNKFSVWISKNWGDCAISIVLRSPPKISERAGPAI